MCNDSFINLAKLGKLPPADLVIIDEIHLAMGPAMLRYLEDYIKDKITIGFSATPKKAEAVFGEAAYSMNLREAITGRGLLANVKAELLSAEPTIDESTLPEDPFERRKAIELAYFKARMETVIPMVKRDVERGRGVFFRLPPGDDIDYARRAKEILREVAVKDKNAKNGLRKILAAEIGGSSQSSGVGKRAKYLILERFDDGKVDALMQVKQLREGWDSPRAKSFYNLHPTASQDELLQNLGRVLRLYRNPRDEPNGPYVDAEAWDFIDEGLGEKQYTCLDALNCKSGERVAYEPMPKRKTEEPGERVEIELLSVEADTIGTVALRHEVQMPEYPDNLSHEEAAVWLGVSKIALGNMLKKLGAADQEVLSAEDLQLVLMDNDKLDAPMLPDDGFVSVQEVMDILGANNAERDKPQMFLRRLKNMGLDSQRYRTPDGFRRFFSREDLRNLQSDESS